MAADKNPPAAPVPPPAKPAKPSLSSAAARRNENVAVNRIDRDVLKEANVRLGVNYAIVPQVPVETTAYASELGRPNAELSVLRPVPAFSGWHADLFANHQNSVFNARTFFQAGPVKPSRQNNYGGRFTTHVRELETLLWDSMMRSRGDTVAHLPEALVRPAPEAVPVDPTIDRLERVLVGVDWNVAQAARELGLSRFQLIRLMKKNNLERP